MKQSTVELINEFNQRYPQLMDLQLIDSIEMIKTSYMNGHKLLVCGNGGSASDALHIVGELMKGFKLPRKLNQELIKKLKEQYPENADYYINSLQQSLPAISLVNEVSLLTAFSNDQAPDLVFAQQVLGHGEEGDILLAISTSGNSKNVIYAAEIAKTLGLKVISLTGETGGKLKNLSDILLNVPSRETYLIQEYHLPIYHLICAVLELEFFGD